MKFSSFALFCALIGVATPHLFWWRSNPTIFHGTGTLHCSLGRVWCFQVALMEIDTFSNDKIAFDGTKCTSAPSYDYVIDGKQNGDGLFDHFYELTMFVSHNCTDRGSKIRIVERFVQEEPVNKSMILIKPWQVSLTNVGEKASNYA